MTETQILYVPATEVKRMVEPYTRNGYEVRHVREARSAYAETESEVTVWLFVLEKVDSEQ